VVAHQLGEESFLTGIIPQGCFRILLLVIFLHLILTKALAREFEHNGTDGVNPECNMLLHIAL
jgi:hypothetical protein